MQVKSNDAVLKMKILVLNGIELLAFDKKGVDKCYYHLQFHS